MKTLLTILVLASFTEAGAQAIIKAYPLEITYNKTSSIIFPTVITSVDRGSKDLLVQKAKGVGNVLQVRAGKPNFSETNLTVITADGLLHHFTVNYSQDPSTYATDLSFASPPDSSVGNGLIFQTAMIESDLEVHSARIVNTIKTLKFHRTNKYKIAIALKGVFVWDNVMFFHLYMDNRSNIDYDVDFLRFYIRDKSKVKRTASQEIALKPIYIHGTPTPLKGRSEKHLVFAFQKFTIPDAKNLIVEVFEMNGGRNLAISITNKTIVNAKPAP